MKLIPNLTYTIELDFRELNVLVLALQGNLPPEELPNASAMAAEILRLREDNARRMHEKASRSLENSLPPKLSSDEEPDRQQPKKGKVK